MKLPSLFRKPKPDEDLRLRLDRLEAAQRLLVEEWEDWYDKFHRLHMRLNKRLRDSHADDLPPEREEPAPPPENDFLAHQRRAEAQAAQMRGGAR